MSKGLGKIQRKILEVMEKKQGYSYGMPITELVVHVYHPERFDPETGDCIGEWSHTQAEHIATHVAVNSLEKKGLIKTKIRRTGRDIGSKRGGTSHEKVIITPASEKDDLEREEKKRDLMAKFGL